MWAEALLADSFGGADCERIGNGFLAQPANAISSLAYVIAGAWILRRTAPRAQPVAIAGALALVGVGVGSFAYHGPQPSWADVAHDASILALAAVFAVLVVGELWRARRGGARRLRDWTAPVAWLAAAAVAYVLGRTSSSWCRPESAWQFHAAWHALSATGLGAAVARLGRSQAAAARL